MDNERGQVAGEVIVGTCGKQFALVLLVEGSRHKGVVLNLRTDDRLEYGRRRHGLAAVVRTLKKLS